MSEPTITLGTTSAFGTLTGWEPQGKAKAKTSQRKNTIGKTGNEVASKLHDEKTEIQQEFKANIETAPDLPPIIGALVGSLILTGIQVNTQGDDFATMTLTGHQHTDNAHADTLQQAAHGITLDRGFGATDFLGGTAGDNADIESSDIDISVQHDDKTSKVGDHFTGNNYTGMMTANTTWNGQPTTGVDSATWDETEDAENEENTSTIKESFSGTRSFDLAPPA